MDTIELERLNSFIEHFRREIKEYDSKLESISHIVNSPEHKVHLEAHEDSNRWGEKRNKLQNEIYDYECGVFAIENEIELGKTLYTYNGKPMLIFNMYYDGNLESKVVLLYGGKFGDREIVNEHKIIIKLKDFDLKNIVRGK